MDPTIYTTMPWSFTIGTPNLPPTLNTPYGPGAEYKTPALLTQLKDAHARVAELESAHGVVVGRLQREVAHVSARNEAVYQAMRWNYESVLESGRVRREVEALERAVEEKESELKEREEAIQKKEEALKQQDDKKMHDSCNDKTADTDSIDPRLEYVQGWYDAMVAYNDWAACGEGCLQSTEVATTLPPMIKNAKYYAGWKAGRSLPWSGICRAKYVERSDPRPEGIGLTLDELHVWNTTEWGREFWIGFQDGLVLDHGDSEVGSDDKNVGGEDVEDGDLGDEVTD